MDEPVLAELCAALEFFVLERATDGAFRRLGLAPSWSRRFFPDSPEVITEQRLCAGFAYLESFLVDARAHWTRLAAERSQFASIDSELWSESGPAGGERLLVASAVQLGSRQLLVIDGSQRGLTERLALLQQAREGHLIHQRLVRSVEQRDILFHCIVHDLATQLSTIRGSLFLLKKESTGAAAKQVVEAGLRAVAKQEALARDILDVFEIEQSGGMEHRGELGSAHPSAATVDLLSCAEDVIQLQRLPASWRKVELRLSAAADASWLVAGERSRLERVLANLIDNALRYAPPGTEVTIGLTGRIDQVLVTVDDQGPGVPSEIESTLFDKFARDHRSGGKIGLGLYFCRVTVERWGGRIGYMPRAPVGSRFWFHLPRSQART